MRSFAAVYFGTVKLIAQMPLGLTVLALTVVAFVGSHFLLSHPMRRWAIEEFGLAGFRSVYTTVAVLLLMAMLVAYHQVPSGQSLWPSGLVLQVVFCVVGYFAVAMFVASLFGNPGIVGANLNGLSTRQPDGVYRVTRHPMMFAIVIWCAVQIMIMPSLRNILSCSGFIVLALVGARLQDTRNKELSGREWTLWAARTPFWPDLRRIGGLGMIWLLAAIPWLLATWLETRVMFSPVGLWYFFPELPY